MGTMGGEEPAEELPEEPAWTDEALPTPLEQDLGGGDNDEESPLGDDPPDQENPAPGPQAVPDRVSAEVESLRSEKSELLNQLRRAQAEFENIRKRLTREKADARQYAAMETIESLLPIVDDFERALKTPGIDPQVHAGLEMIGRRIFDVFERAGLKPVDMNEGKFNPYLHHAVDKAPAKGDEQDQSILEVYQKGYLFKDRLLRAALVKVAVKD